MSSVRLYGKCQLKYSVLLFVFLIQFQAAAKTFKQQHPDDLKVTETNFATVQAVTNVGKRSYHLDNTGDVEVSKALQAIFDDLAAIKDVSATISFAPGIYYLNAPVELKMCGVKLVGHAHGGIDIHGANLATGSIFRFGKDCGPACITFYYDGRSKAFPSGQRPWSNRNLKVEIENLTFVGYNNTGVNTADGYSRFRGDKPNFRGLHWYPSKDRYKDIEKEGQRAIVLPRTRENKGHAKCELFRLTGCYFTDLYVGVDIAGCDVSYIDKNWFGQLTYAIRYHGIGQVTQISDNCFADLETAMILKHPVMSSLHNNTFAYVSKCFEIDHIENSTIAGNVLYNWKISTGAAAHGGFCYIKKSSNLNITGNTITQYLDSRKKTRTVDTETNGQSFIQFDNAEQLLFSDNIVHTVQTQTVIRLHNAKKCVIADNIITYADGGNAVALTGDCSENFYRPVKPSQSAAFDEYKY